MVVPCENTVTAEDKSALDQITIRYYVEARFELDIDGMLVIAQTDFSIEAGVYDGIPDANTLAGLIKDRGIYADDFENRSPASAAVIADALTARGVRPEDIRSASIAEVRFNERTIALALDMGG